MSSVARRIIILRFFILLMAALTTAVAMGNTGGWDFGGDSVWILAWAVSPYFVFLVVSYLVDRFSTVRGRTVLGLVIAILMLAFTIFAYSAPADGSGMDSLMFLFAPAHLFGASLIIYGFTLAVLKLIEK